MNLTESYGSLLLKLTLSAGRIPADGAKITVYYKGTVFSSAFTDRSGCSLIVLPTEQLSLSLDPGSVKKPYRTYDLHVARNGCVPVLFYGVQIFDGVTTVHEYTLTRTYDDPKTKQYIITIPEHRLFSGAEEQLVPQSCGREVFPAFLHTQSGNAVPFLSCLKRFVCRSVYPTWSGNLIAAFAISAATLLLRCRTVPDTLLLCGGGIFENIDRICNQLLGKLLYDRRKNQIADTEAACKSAHGLLALASEAQSFTGLINLLYSTDIIIKEGSFEETVPFTGISYPAPGDDSSDIAYMQSCLNRIAGRVSGIPLSPCFDGGFSREADESVAGFAKAFGQDYDSKVTPRLWSAITFVAAGYGLEPVPLANKADSDAFPGETLGTGCRNSDVLRLQYYLSKISESAGSNVVPNLESDGLYGAKTRRAVAAFQRYYGIPITGNADRETWDTAVRVYYALPSGSEPSLIPYPGTPVRLGDKGRYVSYIQYILNRIGTQVTAIPFLEADGEFGNATKNAVKAFQSFYGLDADGIVGPLTWEKLNTEFLGIENDVG